MLCYRCAPEGNPPSPQSPTGARPLNLKAFKFRAGDPGFFKSNIRVEAPVERKRQKGSEVRVPRMVHLHGSGTGREHNVGCPEWTWHPAMVWDAQDIVPVLLGALGWGFSSAGGSEAQ